MELSNSKHRNENKIKNEEKKISSKKIKDLDNKYIEKMKLFFKEYRCSKCLTKLIINIERKKQDNIIYITTNCKNNHKETKKILDFLKENKFTLENDFEFYDLVTSDIRKKEHDYKKKWLITIC